MTNSLTQARSVLQVVTSRARSRVVFESPTDDEDEEPRIVITMERVLHNDMGCPRQVTVTVEPGDSLN